MQKTLLSLAEAVKISPVSRATFFNMLKDGRLSKSHDGQGKAKIDLSELLRVFGNSLKIGLEPQQLDNSGLSKSNEVKILEDKILELEGMLDDMRHREAHYLKREAWLQSQVELNQKLLGSSKKIGVVQKIMDLLR